MSQPNLQQATILRLADAVGVFHTLLCDGDVTLVAVQSYVADNFPTPCRIVDMVGCSVDLSLIDTFGRAAPQGIVVPKILNLTDGGVQ